MPTKLTGLEIEIIIFKLTNLNKIKVTSFCCYSDIKLASNYDDTNPVKTF